MNGHRTNTMQYAGPDTKASIVENAGAMCFDLLKQADEVARLFGEERQAHATFKTAEEDFDEAVNSAVLDADFRANSVKEGPLKGLARTSDVYKLAIKGIRAELIAGDLRAEHNSLRNFETAYRNASMHYENAKTRLAAMRTVAELQSSILRALAA